MEQKAQYTVERTIPTFEQVWIAAGGDALLDGIKQEDVAGYMDALRELYNVTLSMILR